MWGEEGDRGRGIRGVFTVVIHPCQPSDTDRETVRTSEMKSYHLKWASHLPNMGLVFSTLYQSEDLSDVTLNCEDGSVRAHKLLLSTCSDYFLVSRNNLLFPCHFFSFFLIVKLSC